MDLFRLSPSTVTKEIFAQMNIIEANCGLFAYPPEVLWECIASGDTYTLMDGETMAGFITMDPAETDYFDVSLHIVNVNIAAPYRRRGLAQEMIRAVCRQYAASHAGCMVTLDVEKTNAPALNLYRKLGFTISDMPSENGDSDWLMTVPLEELIGSAHQIRNS